MTKPEFALIEGDARQQILCQLLEEAGYAVQLLPPPEKWQYENMPPPGTLLPAAKASPALRQAAEGQGLVLLEYGSRPDFKTENGGITAENAICIAMSQGLIRGTHILVIGNGAIGKPLAAKLRALGGRVWVAARKPQDLRQAEGAGHCPVPMESLEACLPQVELIFNTVPALVLTRQRLALLSKEARVIDLASKPGGTDFAAAEELGVRAMPALGLPGKMTPKAAAEAVLHAIFLMMREEELL